MRASDCHYAYVLQTGRTVLKARALESDPQVQKIYPNISDDAPLAG